MKDLKKVILENQNVRENIKEIVLGNLEMGSVGSLDFDADHIADDLMPYVMKTILEERKKTLEEVEKLNKPIIMSTNVLEWRGSGNNDKQWGEVQGIGFIEIDWSKQVLKISKITKRGK